MEKKENVKKYKYSVKALAVNGALLKVRKNSYNLFSPGECCICTELYRSTRAVLCLGPPYPKCS